MQLSFDQIARIINRITTRLNQVELLENLVLVFNRADGSDDCLLIYNPEPLPEAKPLLTQLNFKWHRLAGLKLSDYVYFDGPVIGLAAVDLILGGLPTHGVNFYAIEHLWQHHEPKEGLWRTRHRLAKTLLAYLDSLPETDRRREEQYGYPRIIQLALPRLLAGHSLANLVAVLPSADWHAFLDETRPGFTLIYCHKAIARLNQLPGDEADQWIIGLEELGLLRPASAPFQHHFVELRPILRQMGAEAALIETLKSLARHFWQFWRYTKTLKWRSVAYNLAAEACLTAEDVTGLVALIPHYDFDRFVACGDAVRIYRIFRLPLSTDNLDSRAYHIYDLLTKPVFLDAEYATPPLAFAGLEPVLRQFSSEKPQSLTLLLWKAGQVVALANTAWLLSRDLFEFPRPEWIKLNASPTVITLLAVQAVLIYSLSDPWRWRQQRYSLFLHDCYAHLDRCLERQVEREKDISLRYYYSALREWYGCLSSEDYEGNLTRMIQACRNFQESCRQTGEQHALAEAYRISEKLLKTGRKFLRPDQQPVDSAFLNTSEMEKQFLMSKFLRLALSAEQPLHSPSTPFEQFFESYLNIHNRWYQLKQQTPNRRPSTADLVELLTDLQFGRRTINALAHETVLLEAAYNRDIDHINSLRQAVGVNAIINVTLTNPWVTLNKAETLVVFVQNTGSEEAIRFNLELERARGLEFQTVPESLSVPVFTPGERHRLEYRVRVTAPVLTLTFSYHYHDRADRLQFEQTQLPLEIHQPVKRPITMRHNPFEVGRPVAGHHHFFGRNHQLHDIFARLARGDTHPLMLRGPRRIGKSSLMRQIELILHDRKERQERLPAELHNSLDNMHPVSANLQSLDRTTRNYSASFLQLILKNICLELTLEGNVSQDLLAAFARQYPQDGLVRAFSDQVRMIFTLRPQERVVVLMDELDELFREEYGEIARHLRTIMQEEQPISWITASTMLTKGLMGAYGSVFFNLLEAIEVRGLEWEAAHQLITELSSSVNLDWTVEAIVAIQELTGQRPYLLQLLCAKIVDYVNRNGLDRVEPSSVWAVTNQILRDKNTTDYYLGFIWEEATWLGRLMMWFMDSIVPETLSRATLWQALEEAMKIRNLAVDGSRLNKKFDERLTWLEKITDVISIDKNISFNVPLVQQWLHQVITHQEDFLDSVFEGIVEELAKG